MIPFQFVAKRRGNPNWGKPDVFKESGPTTFEQLVRKLRLGPDQYEHSTALKTWVRKNKNQKYIPPELLKAWALDVNAEWE